MKQDGIRKGNPFVEKFLLHHVIARNEAISALANQSAQ